VNTCLAIFYRIAIVLPEETDQPHLEELQALIVLVAGVFDQIAHFLRVSGLVAKELLAGLHHLSQSVCKRFHSFKPSDLLKYARPNA